MMLTSDDMTPEGAAAYNDAQGALADLGVATALAVGKPARALDVALAAPHLRARYQAAMPAPQVAVGAPRPSNLRRLPPRLRVVETPPPPPEAG